MKEYIVSLTGSTKAVGAVQRPEFLYAGIEKVPRTSREAIFLRAIFSAIARASNDLPGKRASKSMKSWSALVALSCRR